MNQIDALNKAMNEYLADMPDTTPEDGKLRAAFRVAFRCGWTACELHTSRSALNAAYGVRVKAERAEYEAAKEFQETLAE